MITKRKLIIIIIIDVIIILLCLSFLYIKINISKQMIPLKYGDKAPKLSLLKTINGNIINLTNNKKLILLFFFNDSLRNNMLSLSMFYKKLKNKKRIQASAIYTDVKNSENTSKFNKYYFPVIIDKKLKVCKKFHLNKHLPRGATIIINKNNKIIFYSRALLNKELINQFISGHYEFNKRSINDE